MLELLELVFNTQLQYRKKGESLPNEPCGPAPSMFVSIFLTLEKIEFTKKAFVLFPPVFVVFGHVEWSSHTAARWPGPPLRAGVAQQGGPALGPRAAGGGEGVLPQRPPRPRARGGGLKCRKDPK